MEMQQKNYDISTDAELTTASGAGGQAALRRRMRPAAGSRNRSVTGAVLWALQAAIGTLQQYGPGAAGLRDGVFVAYLAVTLTMSLLCLLVGPRLKGRSFEVAEQLVVGGGWLATAWLVQATGGAASADLGLFANVMFYCAYFMSEQRAAINVALGTSLMWAPLLYDNANVVENNFVSRAIVMTSVLWAMALLIARNRRATQLAEIAARRLALTDPLTGVANLHTFNDELNLELSDAIARGERLGVAFVDVNGLKAANTVYGHAGGDQLIRATAEALLAVSGPGDTVARVGGDEFAVLVPGGDAELMKRFEADFAQAIAGDQPRLGNKQFELSASIGTAVHPADGATLEGLMEVADQRMYDSKASLPPMLPTPGTTGGHTLSDQPTEGTSKLSALLSKSAPASSFAWLLAAAMVVAGAVSTGSGDVHPRTAFGLAGVCLGVAGALALLKGDQLRRGVSCANGLAVAIAVPAVWATGGAATPILPLVYLVVAQSAYTLPTRAALIRTLTMLGILVAMLVANISSAHFGAVSVIFGEVLVIAALLRYNRMRADAAERRALELSRTDALTGLANRRVFENTLMLAAEARGQLRASAAHDDGGLILIDVDNFKKINSSGGHKAGDEVLRMIAAVLEGAAGEGRTVCRIGGDEFAVIVSEGGSQELMRTAAKCQNAVAAVDWRVLCEPKVTISAGYASWRDVATWKELVVAADLAMRASKDAGKNTVSSAPGRSLRASRVA
jgi:diguanylate cyclase (GGDEF)-like protein